MKHISLFSLMFLISIVASAQKKDEKAIRKCFDQYKTAILNDRGDAAAKQVDANTIDYYTQVADWVRTADSVTVDQMNTLDKMMVLMIRHQSLREEILAFTGESLFIYSVEKSMVGKGSVEETTIGTLTINGKTAQAQLLVNGEASPEHFTFRKESRTWKLDLTQVMKDSLASLDQAIIGMGMTANDFILGVLPYSNGIPVRPDIWQPVK